MTCVPLTLVFVALAGVALGTPVFRRPVVDRAARCSVTAPGAVVRPQPAAAHRGGRRLDFYLARRRHLADGWPPAWPGLCWHAPPVVRLTAQRHGSPPCILVPTRSSSGSLGFFKLNATIVTTWALMLDTCGRRHPGHARPEPSRPPQPLAGHARNRRHDAGAADRRSRLAEARALSRLSRHAVFVPGAGRAVHRPAVSTSRPPGRCRPPLHWHCAC